MKFFLTAFAVLLSYSSVALADGNQPLPPEGIPMDYWRSVVTTRETARTPEAFRQLQAKYPGLMDHVNADYILNAEVNTHVYAWEGPSSCQAGDPRLEYTTRFYSLCTNSPDGAGMCEATKYRLPPATTDPCGPKWTKSGVYQESTEERQRIVELHQEFPQYFTGLSIESVTKVTLDLDILNWEGATVCPADDPRLMKFVGSAEVCFDAIGVDVCTNSMDAIPANIDPCL